MGAVGCGDHWLVGALLLAVTGVLQQASSNSSRARFCAQECCRLATCHTRLLGAPAAAAAAAATTAAPTAAAAAVGTNSSLGGVVRAAALSVQSGGQSGKQAGAVGVLHGCSGVRGQACCSRQATTAGAARTCAAGSKVVIARARLFGPRPCYL